MENKNISRRNFLKVAGAAGITAGLAACDNQKTSGGTATQAAATGEMTYRTNPATGEKVSLLGYGCMRWPMKAAGEGNNEIVDQETVNELVDYAISHGINYFDTAPSYCRGLSEKATGTALKRHPRSSYNIATKMSNHHLVRQGLSSNELYEASMQMYRNSFENLQTDYIDYYLLHFIGMEGLSTLMKRFFDNNLIDFLLKEREAGRIRNLGFSYHGDINAFNYLLSRHDEFHWNFVQIQLNYMDYRHASGWNYNAEYLYEELDKRNIPIVVMEPLLGGRLAGLTDFLNSRLKQHRPDDSIASWAFRFAGSFPRVMTVLSGMTYMEHLQDNLRTFSPLDPCTDDELALLEDTAQVMLKYPSVPCTACQYCMPCPYGLDIPGIFAHYNRCINEGNVPASSQSENYRKARRAFLVGYDRSVPRLRQANHCIGCKQCSPRCPQTIDIPAQMQRIDNFVEQLKQGTL